MFSITAPVGAAFRVSRLVARHGTHIALATAILIGGAQAKAAQHPTKLEPAAGPRESEQPSRWEFLVASGTAAPLGAQRHVFERADLTAVQLSYVIRPEFALTAAVGWARSRDSAALGEPKLDIFTYDIGAEFRGPIKTSSSAVTLRPFAGIGAGGRSYNSHAGDVDATHNIAAYLSAGGEVGVRRVRLRLEVRDYVSDYKSLNGAGSSGVRNDVVAMIGLRIAGR